MRSFTDVRKRLTPGAILECVENTKRKELNGTRRRVEKIQTNAIAWYALPIETGAPLCWTYFPPARMVEILDTDTFRMALHRDTPQFTVTLRFWRDPSPGDWQSTLREKIAALPGLFREAARRYPSCALYLFLKPATATEWGDFAIAPAAPPGFDFVSNQRIDAIPFDALPIRLQEQLRRVPIIAWDV